MDETAAREHLIKTSQEFRQLVEKHQAYERQLQEFLENHHLTPDDQFQEAIIKKKKLALKDQMQVLIERYQSNGTAHQ